MSNDAKALLGVVVCTVIAATLLGLLLWGSGW